MASVRLKNNVSLLTFIRLLSGLQMRVADIREGAQFLDVAVDKIGPDAVESGIDASTDVGATGAVVDLAGSRQGDLGDLAGAGSEKGEIPGVGLVARCNQAIRSQQAADLVRPRAPNITCRHGLPPLNRRLALSLLKSKASASRSGHTLNQRINETFIVKLLDPMQIPERQWI